MEQDPMQTFLLIKNKAEEILLNWKNEENGFQWEGHNWNSLVNTSKHILVRMACEELNIKHSDYLNLIEAASYEEKFKMDQIWNSEKEPPASGIAAPSPL